MSKTIKLIGGAVLLVFTFSFITTTPLETARGLYPKLDKGELYVDSLINLTSKYKSNAIMLAYNGASTTAKASYLSNPFSKYSIAKSGLETLNSSVSKASNNIEVRFIRYSVELNIPGIMPFTSHVESDKKFIIDNIDKNHSYYPEIKKFMLKFVSLTKEEKAKFN